MPIDPAIRDAWSSNLNVNLVLIDHLEPPMMALRTPGDGYTVAGQLAHLAETLSFWGERLSPAIAELPDLGDPDRDPDGVETDPVRIRAVLAELAAAVLAAARSADDTGSLTHPSLGAFLIHMMVHDAHHRGQILLALKSAGYPLPDEDVMWGPFNGRA